MDVGSTRGPQSIRFSAPFGVLQLTNEVTSRQFSGPQTPLETGPVDQTSGSAWSEGATGAGENAPGSNHCFVLVPPENW